MPKSESQNDKLLQPAKGQKGEAMRRRLLDAARIHFLNHGFAGASINDIAKVAGVHKSHLYHYFSSKEALWLAVKQMILEESLGHLQVPSFPDDTLENFVTSFVHYRFGVYAKSPDLARMLSWQRLEPDNLQLRSAPEILEGNARACLEALKREGLMDASIEVNMAMVLLLRLPPSLFLEGADITSNTPSEFQVFEALIIRCLVTGLSPLSSVQIS